MEEMNIDDIRRVVRGGTILFCIKVYGDWIPILTCRPTTTRSIKIDGVDYIDNRYISIYSDENICSQISKEILYYVIQDAIITITQNDYLVDIPKNDIYLNEYLKEIDNVEFVKDVICFPYDGEIPLEDEVMQKLYLEKPTRKACLDLMQNGIQTLMSSANKNNALNREKVDEDKIYIGQDEPWVIGNGYAWIMLDWDDLDDDNKKYLISIQEGKKEIVEDEKSQIELIKFYEYVDVSREVASRYDYDSKKIVDNIQLTPIENDVYYDLNKVYLIGNNSLNNRARRKESNHLRTVAIRYPVNENTTVKEVEEYYNKIVSGMINKNIIDSNQNTI